MTELLSYPGARRPDRRRTVSSDGLSIAVWEWGEEDAPPALLAHGGFDFAATFDLFAPLLADGGWRIVGWDQRGHGDSDHAAMYGWEADLRDALAVLDSTTRRPCPLLAHSKGGGLMLELAHAMPHRVSHVVNIDGLPSPRRHPDVADHERSRMLGGELEAWLDHHRKMSELERKPGTLEELAQRRARMNPRLPMDWLRYLVPIGARRDDDGWRWKIDPALRFGGFGPWRPSWSIERLAGLGAPLLGFLGLQPEQMGWGTEPGQLEPYLPPGARLVVFEDSGHFVHVEKPVETAEAVLEFLS